MDAEQKKLRTLKTTWFVFLLTQVMFAAVCFIMGARRADGAPAVYWDPEVFKKTSGILIATFSIGSLLLGFAIHRVAHSFSSLPPKTTGQTPSPDEIVRNSGTSYLFKLFFMEVSSLGGMLLGSMNENLLLGIPFIVLSAIAIALSPPTLEQIGKI